MPGWRVALQIEVPIHTGSPLASRETEVRKKVGVGSPRSLTAEELFVVGRAFCNARGDLIAHSKSERGT